MNAVCELVNGVESFTMLDLLRKAAAHKGLTMLEGASRAYSEPIKVYTLDEATLAELARHKITRQARPDCNDEIFTLVDENPQQPFPGFVPSCHWNFEPTLGDKHRFYLRIELCASLKVNEESGIKLFPMAIGVFVSPADALPNFRMFKALVENDPSAPDVAKEIAASEGSVIVPWTDLGLDGIKTLRQLFDEFSNGNTTVFQLARDGKVFNPSPFRYSRRADEVFVATPAQPRLLQAWQSQLSEYRDRLVV